MAADDTHRFRLPAVQAHTQERARWHKIRVRVVDIVKLVWRSVEAAEA
jgi:translation initiation factor IF-1